MKPGHKLIVTATGLAVLVLLVTFLAGGSLGRKAAPPIAPIAGKVPTMTQSATLDSGIALVERADQIYYQDRSPGGGTISIYAQQAKPAGKGVMQLAEPRMRMERGQGRVVELAADVGRFTATHETVQQLDQLRYGELIGNVVIRLLDVQASGKSITRMRIELEDAHFDNDLGELSSDKSVVVTAGRVRFVGRRMTMNYNDLHQRLDRLVIEEGQYLRFAPRPPGPRSRSPRQVEDHENPVLQIDDSLHTAPPKHTEYYDLTFERDIRVQSKQFDMHADDLAVVFTERGSESDVIKNDPSARHDTTDRVNNDEQTDDDVVVTWSGQLILVPRRERPGQMSPSDDVMVSLTGNPVRITTLDNEHIDAEKVTYFLDSQQIIMEGSGADPFRIRSPIIGQIIARKLHIDQQSHWGKLIGPGKWRTHNQSRNSTTNTTQMPDDMTVTWTQGVDLTFYPTESGSEMKMGIGFLRTVSFYGDVMINEPSFDLSADRVGIGLSEPESDRQRAHTLSSAGDVRLHTHGDDAQPPMTVWAQDHITLEMTGQTEPGATWGELFAEGSVRLEQADKKLQTESLEVTLRRNKDDQLEPVTMTAQRGVHIEFEGGDGESMAVTADRAIYDEQRHQTELFAAKDQPVRIERSDMELTGGYIVLATVPGAQVMQVIGAGAATFRYFFRNNHFDVWEKPALMTVTWADAMRYDDAAGQVHFKGQVKTTGRKGLDATQLTSDEMNLWLVDVSQADEQAVTSDAQTAVQSVKRVRADGDVVFLATSYIDRIGAKVARRLSITGPKMIFENRGDGLRRKEQIRFVGDGTMFLEDYRPRPNQMAAKGASPHVLLTGRGRTVFTWEGQLLLDALDNDMRLDDQVWMKYQPLDKSARAFELTCDRFIADLVQTGGLANWTSGQAPQMQIQSVTADRTITVNYDKMIIRTNHLRYSAHDEFITLTPDEGLQTIITTEEHETRTSDPLRWHRLTNRFGGGSFAPTRQQLK